MIVWQNGAYTPEYLAQEARRKAFLEARGPTKPFEVGKAYQTHEGKTVTCVELSTTRGYECARFDDGETVPAPNGVGTNTTGWRYNRDQDRGRCTGSAGDHSDPRCVIPESAS